MLQSTKRRVKNRENSHLSEERTYEEQKAELEAKIKALNEERSTLLNEIPKLEKRGTILDLGYKMKTLQDEVLSLRAKKNALLNEISKYSDVVAETKTVETEVSGAPEEAKTQEAGATVEVREVGTPVEAQEARAEASMETQRAEPRRWLKNIRAPY